MVFRLFGLCLIWILASGVPAFSHEANDEPYGESVKKPGDVYRRVQALNQGLSLVLRKHSEILKAVKVNAHLFEHPLAPRHVFQRALDVEHKLVGLLLLNSLEYRTTDDIEVRDYQPDQVYELVERLGELVRQLLSAHDIEAPQIRAGTERKNPQDVYFLLERMDGFLLKMGAPDNRPENYLRRAKALVSLARQICNSNKCEQITNIDEDSKQLISPLDIYVETLKFIQAMDNLVQRLNLPVKGGIVAFKPENKVVTPTQINSLLGVALADMIEVSYRMKLFDKLVLTAVPAKATTREVYLDIRLARHLLEQRLSQKQVH